MPLKYIRCSDSRSVPSLLFSCIKSQTFQETGCSLWCFAIRRLFRVHYRSLALPVFKNQSFYAFSYLSLQLFNSTDTVHSEFLGNYWYLIRVASWYMLEPEPRSSYASFLLTYYLYLIFHMDQEQNTLKSNIKKINSELTLFVFKQLSLVHIFLNQVVFVKYKCRLSVGCMIEARIKEFRLAQEFSDPL